MVTSSAVIDQLARTKGWTLFFSVLLWIGAAFLVLAAIVMFVVGALGGASMAGQGGMPGLGAPIMGFVLGVLYLAFALAYIYPALKLGNFSRRVSELMESPSENGLILALNEQRAFWKYIGILAIVFITLYVLIVVVAVIGSIAGAAA